MVNAATYRRSIESQGRTVRSYIRREHEPQQPGETDDQFRRRRHRDLARRRRNVADEDVRPWTDLSALTAEEKAEHKRRQACERKRKQRAKASS